MKKLLPILFCLFLTACNLSLTSSDEDLGRQVATGIALTLEAQATATPLLENAPLPTPTLPVTEIPLPTITPTYSVPMLIVTDNTNCRSGPGQSFDIETTLVTGTSAEIIGKHPTDNYWVVKPEGMNEPCWLWGEYVTVTGSYWVVPEMTLSPTASTQSAAQPIYLLYEFNCSLNAVNSDIAVFLSWNDEADAELGYRVYRDNTLVADLPANSTVYAETIAADATQTISYSVSAYNADGELGRDTVSFSCQ